MFLGNGTSLVELLVPKTLSDAATALVEAMDLNSITAARRDGRAVIIKRRNAVGERLANLANSYFSNTRIPIRFLAAVKDWRRREINSFNLLNGDRFRARPSGEHRRQITRPQPVGPHEARNSHPTHDCGGGQRTSARAPTEERGI